MPLAGGAVPPPTFFESLIPLFHAEWHPTGVAITQAVTLPGQVVVSFLIVLLSAWKLRAPWWVAAWLGATIVEAVIRHILTRPELYRGGVHLTGFDASWPSGHALHFALVAAVLATAWPLLRAPLAAWLAAAAVLLAVAGFHTPTDVAGGLLLAVLALLTGRALRQA